MNDLSTVSSQVQSTVSGRDLSLINVMDRLDKYW